MLFLGDVIRLQVIGASLIVTTENPYTVCMYVGARMGGRIFLFFVGPTFDIASNFFWRDELVILTTISR